ncbi:MAG: hypothetical protein AB7I30_20115 [Isosphaeraceae bacterium]
MHDSVRETVDRHRAGVSLGLAAALALWGGSHAREAQAAAPPVALLASSLTTQGGYGTIKGRLVWGGEQAPAPTILVAKGQASKDPSVCASTESIPSHALEVDGASKGIRYGFAYLVRPSGSNPGVVEELVKSAPIVEIDQRNCDFLPHSVAVHQDQTLRFKSSDPVNHNVHLTPFVNPPFNLILAANGEVERKLLAERRPIPLVCDIHPWMKGWIMVFDHPFFAVTEKDGSFEIKGAPPGAQKLVVWQESVGYVTVGLAAGMPVTVEPSKTTDVGEIKLDPSKVRN